MLDILSITGPIYIAIALGWLATRAGLFERADMRVLGRFVLYVALPALLFDAVSKRHVADILDWRYLLVYALSGLATMGLALLWFRRVARHAGQGPQLVLDHFDRNAFAAHAARVGYPLGVAAALASIKLMEEEDGALYRRWDAHQARLVSGLKEIARRHSVPMLLQEVRGCIFYQFTELPVAYNMGEWMAVADHARQEQLRSILFQTGALILFRGRWFVNSALGEPEITRTLELTDAAMKKICAG